MSLANLLELHETEQSEKLDELEIKYGLTQVSLCSCLSIVAGLADLEVEIF